MYLSPRLKIHLASGYRLYFFAVYLTVPCDRLLLSACSLCFQLQSCLTGCIQGVFQHFRLPTLVEEDVLCEEEFKVARVAYSLSPRKRPQPTHLGAADCYDWTPNLLHDLGAQSDMSERHIFFSFEMKNIRGI